MASPDPDGKRNSGREANAEKALKALKDEKLIKHAPQITFFGAHNWYELTERGKRADPFKNKEFS